MPDTSFENGAIRGSVLCREMAHSVLDDYTKQLIDMVENSSHGLTIDDIRTFLVHFKEDQVVNQSAKYKEAFQRCVDRREQEVFGLTRREPFKRILTMSFAHMFPPKGHMVNNGKYISRRVLHGLFLTLEKMVGEGAFIRGREICMRGLDKVKTKDGTIIWEDLYVQEKPLEAVDDLLMNLVQYFDNPQKRLAWMLDLINAELGDPEAYQFEGDDNKTWHLDERNLILIMRNLFHHLRLRLKDKAHAQALAAKYGPERARALVSLFKTLDHAKV